MKCTPKFSAFAALLLCSVLQPASGKEELTSHGPIFVNEAAERPPRCSIDFFLPEELSFLSPCPALEEIYVSATSIAFPYQQQQPVAITPLKDDVIRVAAGGMLSFSFREQYSFKIASQISLHELEVRVPVEKTVLVGGPLPDSDRATSDADVQPSEPQLFLFEQRSTTADIFDALRAALSQIGKLHVLDRDETILRVELTSRGKIIRSRKLWERLELISIAVPQDQSVTVFVLASLQFAPGLGNSMPPTGAFESNEGEHSEDLEIFLADLSEKLANQWGSEE